MSYYLFRFTDESAARKASEHITRLMLKTLVPGLAEGVSRHELSDRQLEWALDMIKTHCAFYGTHLVVGELEEMGDTHFVQDLEEMGGEYFGWEEAEPTVSVTLKLPEGAGGERLEQELRDFYILKEPVLAIDCPWDPEFDAEPGNTMRPTDTFFHTDGETVVFSVISGPHKVPLLEDYLKERGVSSYRITVCDGLHESKADLFILGDVCPDCRRRKLRYLAAELESLPEDQYSCPACGGMFTREGLTAGGSFRHVGTKLCCIESLGDTLFAAEVWGKILRMGADLEFEVVGQMDFNVGYFVAFTQEHWIACGGTAEKRGRVYYTKNAGQSWRTAFFPTSPTIHGLFRVPGRGVVYLSTHEGVYCSRDEGRIWQLVFPGNRRIYYMQCLSEKIIFAVDIIEDGGGNKILRSRDAGKSWEESTLDDAYYGLRQLLMLDELVGLILNPDGNYALSDDGGRTWRSAEQQELYFRKFLPGSEGIVYAIASRKGEGSPRRLCVSVTPLLLLESRDRGRTWQHNRDIKAWDFSCALLRPNGDLYLGNSRGLLIKQAPGE